ncbi:MAG: TetR family transcriptional regulator [Thiotrichales bacterium]
MVRRTKEAADQTRARIIAAARGVFAREGVGRATLEGVAVAAGVTRGAVYWHFTNKAQLFFALKEHSLRPLADTTDTTLSDPTHTNPLDAIETAMCHVVEVMELDPEVRETLEVITLRCEFVGAFEPLVAEIVSSHRRLRDNLTAAYGRAEALGLLRAGLDPELLGSDSMVFLLGLVHEWMREAEGGTIRARARALIRSHIALRRR